MSRPSHATEPGAGIEQAQDAARERGLAATAFANHAHRLAGAQGEADAIDGAEWHALAEETAGDMHREGDVQIIDFQQRFQFQR